MKHEADSRGDSAIIGRFVTACGITVDEASRGSYGPTWRTRTPSRDKLVGSSLLELADRLGFTEVRDILVRAGADPNAR